MSAPAAAIPNAEHPQCQFFVIRKKRLCRMTVRPGRQYCGEHEPQPPADLLEADKRIPCPNDPKHTCYASKLEKHLTKCNARQTEDPPYIVLNVNAPEDENQCPRRPLKDVSAHTLRLVIDKINQLYDKHVLGSISTWQPPPTHHPAVEACIQQADRGDTSRRHLRQASRLMQLAEEHGLVHDHTCYVELGAGKGMLSYYMGTAWCTHTSSHVVCVDRAALRHKRDNLLRGDAAARLRADLRHLHLHRADMVQRAHAVVGVAKHLCGVATDYALRCVTGAGVVNKTRGVLLATCCHHRCEAGLYVGGHKLKELGISSEELNIMFSVVSWATCGDGRSRDRRLPQLHNTGNGEVTVGASQVESKTNNHNDKEINNKTVNDVVVDIEIKTKKQKLAQEQSINNTKESEQDNNTSKNTSINTDSKHKCDSNPKIKDTVLSTTETKEEVKNTCSSSSASADPSGSGHLQESKGTDTFQPLDIKTREEIGRRAKALLDHGRVLYLRDLGFEASLCYYVPTTESLENVCIVAKKLVAGTVVS